MPSNKRPLKESPYIGEKGEAIKMTTGELKAHKKMSNANRTGREGFAHGAENGRSATFFNAAGTYTKPTGNNQRLSKAINTAKRENGM